MNESTIFQTAIGATPIGAVYGVTDTELLGFVRKIINETCPDSNYLGGEIVVSKNRNVIPKLKLLFEKQKSNEVSRTSSGVNLIETVGRTQAIPPAIYNAIRPFAPFVYTSGGDKTVDRRHVEIIPNAEFIDGNRKLKVTEVSIDTIIPLLDIVFLTSETEKINLKEIDDREDDVFFIVMKLIVPKREYKYSSRLK